MSSAVLIVPAALRSQDASFVLYGPPQTVIRGFQCPVCISLEFILILFVASRINLWAVILGT